MKIINKINLQIQRVLDVFLGAASTVMLAASPAQVLGQHIFHSSITWSEELSAYMYVRIIFLALYTAYRERSELGTEIPWLRDPKERGTVLMVRELLGLTVCMTFLCRDVLVVRSSLAFPQKTASLKITAAYLYFYMPLGFTSLIWMRIVHIIHGIWSLSNKKTDKTGTGKQRKERKMSIAAIVLIVSVIIFAVLRMPLVWPLVLAYVCSVATGGAPDALPILIQRIFTGGLQYSLLTVFFFVLADTIVQYGGPSKRLVSFASSLAEHISGRASLVRVITCTLFTAIPGSTVATTVAIGEVMYPELERLGYPEDYTAAFPAAVGILGVIISPSIPLILCGNVASTSSGKLLMAGVTPSLTGAFSTCVTCCIFAEGKSYPRNKGFEAKVVIKTLGDSIWTLLMPIVILGGTYMGVFTLTESGVAAVTYGLTCAIVIYRDMDPALFKRVIKEGYRIAANVMILCMAATSFSYLFTIYQIPAASSRFLIANVSNRYMFIIEVITLLLFLRMFMDMAASILILAPMLAPVTVTLGIDPIQFDPIFVFTMVIDQAALPFETNLFMVYGYSRRLVVFIERHSLVFCSTLVLVILLCTVFPDISTLFPGVITQ